jgi:hypothetical protein
MSLVSRLTSVITAIGAEVKNRISADHPGVARAWVCFGYINNTIQIQSSFNVASVTRLSSGRYRITFATPFADNQYCWVAMGRSNTATGTIRFASDRSTTDNKNTSNLELVCTSGSASLADSTEINVVVYR